jgi:hypothetical protein
MINFTDLINRKEPIRYKMDVLQQGQIGGYCKYVKNVTVLYSKYSIIYNS